MHSKFLPSPISTSKQDSLSWSFLGMKNASINTGLLPRHRLLCLRRWRGLCRNTGNESRDSQLRLRGLIKPMLGHLVMRFASKTFLKSCLIALSLLSVSHKACAADKSSPVAKQADDGSVRMIASAAKIQGPNAKLVGSEVKDIMWWTSMDTSLRWTASV